MDNIYLFAGNGYMINKNLKSLRAKLFIQFEELNVSVFKEMPSVDELIGVCSQVPFMSDKRLIIIKQLSLLAPKGNKDESKKMADYLPQLASTTVLVMCFEGSPDKRRALYKQIKKLGAVNDYSEPKTEECIRFALGEAKKSGSTMKRQAADALVSIVGCDYYAIENEIAKLSIYADGGEITQNHIRACASKTLEYNVFEMHNLLIKKKTTEAFCLLEEILMDGRPEALIGLIAYNLREMYKVKAMLDANFAVSKITSVLKSRDFIIRRRVGECKNFSIEELRRGLSSLSELDYNTKSGKKDPQLSLHETLIKIYKLRLK